MIIRDVQLVTARFRITCVPSEKDIGTACLVAKPSHIANRDIVRACGVFVERCSPKSRIADTARITVKSGVAQRGIVGSGVFVQTPRAYRCAVAASGIVIQRIVTRGGILETDGIEKHRVKATGRIVVAGSVVIERKIATGHVVVAGSVGSERTCATGRVIGASRVVL